MSDVVKKLLDFITGKDIDARHEELVKQVKSLEDHYETETLRLRSDLAAVTEDRDRMREALNNVVSAVYSTRASIGVACIDIQVIDRIRAALEGVTKKEGAGNE